jgi:hypothetical protein
MNQERLKKDLIHFLRADVTYLFSHDKWECYIFEDDGVAYYAIITDDCGGTGKMCVKKIDKSFAVEEIIECMQYADENASPQLRIARKKKECQQAIKDAKAELRRLEQIEKERKKWEAQNGES